MKRKTSRVLNDESFILGLSYLDITGVGIFLLILLFVAKALHLESMLWALVLSMGLLFCLIPVRLKFRKKIIRDFLNYTSQQGVSRVSKNHRKP